MKISMFGVHGLGGDFPAIFGLDPDVDSVALAELDPNLRTKARKMAKITHAVERLAEHRVRSVSMQMFEPEQREKTWKNVESVNMM